MNLEELLARLADLSSLTPEDLTEIETQLRATYRDLRAGSLSPDVVEVLGRIAAGLDSIRTETATREEAVAELERQAAELDAALEPVAEDDEPVGDEPDAPAEDAPADDAEGDEPDAEPEAEATAPALEPVVAAAPRPLSDLARRTPISTRPVAQRQSGARVTATPNVPNMRGGQEITSREELASAMSEVWNANRGAEGSGVKVAAVRVTAEYPEERILSRDDSVWTTWEKINTVLSEFSTQQAITAAGGICAPTTPLYEQVVISHASRPVRDSLPGFQATRGGINWITPPSLASIGTSGGSPNQAIGQVTEAQDAADAIKTHQLVTCGSPQSATIYAVTNILEFGNLMQRTFPEEVAAYTDLSLAAQARFAENLLLTSIATGSTAVTTAQTLGARVDILNTITLAAVAYRNRHRMPVDAPLRVLLPAWVVGMIQNDLWSAFNVGPDEQGVNVTQATITSWLGLRNVNATFFEDGVGPSAPDYQIFPAQAAGALNPWPAAMQWYMFHEGAWLFLDGGTLDLGIVRDSTLNAANKFQTFTETFEQVAFVGIESLKILSSLCVNGASAGTIDPDTLCDIDS